LRNGLGEPFWQIAAGVRNSAKRRFRIFPNPEAKELLPHELPRCMETNGIEGPVESFLRTLKPSRRGEMDRWIQVLRTNFPRASIRFFSGLNQEGRAVTLPTLGFGSYLHRFANGTTEDLFQVGVRLTQKGISIHCLGLPKGCSLPDLFGPELGAQKITSYSIQFDSFQSLNLDVFVAGLAHVYPELTGMAD